jgi:hypothetical protein
MRRTLLVALVVYPAWLLLGCIHELGHVLHAWLSGATVVYVDIPLIGFSRTEVSHNNHPQFIAWGGAIWGSLVPLLAWLILPQRWITVRRAMQAFAGFCLIANGVYLGVGWTGKAGDAADLLKHGAPLWTLIAIGAGMTIAGLWLWHDLGSAVRAAEH